ncbi:Dilute [Phaffia rhodozyma]|uniref:Dilute n=1 Tax=Phaffia rhodozyma TaxID=264483 RepID=A0A0F7SH65_PHARH|nr:Dilute [Phaffia rhodozyma]
MILEINFDEGIPALNQATTASAYSLNAPPLPLKPCPENIAPHFDLPPEDLLPVLENALFYSCQSGDSVLLQWLLSLQGGIERLLPLRIVDEDGCDLVSVAIMGSSGREDREECVRMLVPKVGIGGRDSAGWSCLHYAALHSTPALLSFLLTAGADPHLQTRKGLTALDIISDLDSRAEQTIILTSVMTSTPPSYDSYSAPSDSTSNKRPVARRRSTASISASVARSQLARRQEQRELMREKKERWVSTVAEKVGVPAGRLTEKMWEGEEADEVDRKLQRKKREGRKLMNGLNESESESDAIDLEEADRTNSVNGDDEDEDDYDDDPAYSSMLVFSLPTLPSLLDSLISSCPPNPFPREWKAAPANSVYLFARFALYRCDEEWLIELLDSVVDRIEQVIYANADDLSHLAFWLYNCTLLLHLLRSDADLKVACHELDLFISLQELIDAIHVFVIRFIERKVDILLDAALLDWEPMSEEFSDLSFEGEWNFLRNLTGRGTNAKRAAEKIVPRALDVFSSTINTSANANAKNEGCTSTTRGSLDLSGFKIASLKKRASIAEIRSALTQSTKLSTSQTDSSVMEQTAEARSASVSSVMTPKTSKVPKTTPTTPKTITSFLTSVLVVLQLYEVNPAIICQSFAQVYYWIGCETFNRILIRKKYLCRSKAVQIRMNVCAMEDWVREAGLPIRMASKHLESVNQLLQWLQTCSRLDDFDDLVVMVSSLRSLNPVQMRRAVRDYRFEVNEERMSEECAQYLAQLQKDWEKRRTRVGVEARLRELSMNENERPINTDLLDAAVMWVDKLFEEGDSGSGGEHDLPGSPECQGELMDSRFMLPFALPSENTLLTTVPPPGAPFELFHLEEAGLNRVNDTDDENDGRSSLVAGSVRSSMSSSRPSSRASGSCSGARSLRFVRRTHRPVQDLPLGFLTWLDSVETAKVRKDRRTGDGNGGKVMTDLAGPDVRTPVPLSNGSGDRTDPFESCVVAGVEDSRIAPEGRYDGVRSVPTGWSPRMRRMTPSRLDTLRMVHDDQPDVSLSGSLSPSASSVGTLTPGYNTRQLDDELEKEAEKADESNSWFRRKMSWSGSPVSRKRLDQRSAE